MYENIGGKIKGLAKMIFIVETIVAVISGLSLLISDDSLALIGLIVIVVGPIVAWVSSWFLYGFGELVDKICEIEHNMRVDKIDSEVKEKGNNAQVIGNKTANVSEEKHEDKYVEIICDNCQNHISVSKVTFANNSAITCPKCNNKIR